MKVIKYGIERTLVFFELDRKLGYRFVGIEGFRVLFIFIRFSLYFVKYIDFWVFMI